MLAFGRIEGLARATVSGGYKSIKALKTFDLQPFLLSCIESFAPIFKMLLSNYSKRLWSVVYDQICKTYLLMIITLSTQYSPKETKDLVAKLKVDKQLFKELFAGQINAKEIEEHYQTIDTLEHCLTDHIEEVIAYLVPLAVALGPDFNDNCIVSDSNQIAILRLRPDVDKAHKEMFMEIVKMKRQAIKAASQKSGSTRFYFAAKILPKVTKFISQLRKAVFRTQEIRKANSINLNKTKYFSLTHNDLVVSFFHLGHREASQQASRNFRLHQTAHKARRKTRSCVRKYKQEGI